MSLIRFIILDVDARDKRGHDESNIARIGITCVMKSVLHCARRNGSAGCCALSPCGRGQHGFLSNKNG